MLFRVALAIFKLNEHKILEVDDPLEVFQVVQVRYQRWNRSSNTAILTANIQNMPKRMLDCHRLMEVSSLGGSQPKLHK